jgi:hypothetical protein
LERSSSGDFGYETDGALGAGGGQRSEDLPSSRAFFGFVTTVDFARDHPWATNRVVFIATGSCIVPIMIANQERPGERQATDPRSVSGAYPQSSYSRL